jgi:hypothetical protein
MQPDDKTFLLQISSLHRRCCKHASSWSIADALLFWC